MKAAAALFVAGILAALEAPRAGGAGAGAGARPFETWEAGLEGGWLMPLGDLAEVLDPAPLLGFRAATSYYGDWRATAGVSGARLDGAGSPVPVAFVAGAAGLEWRSRRPWIPAPGAALALYYVRATRDTDEYLFLDDGESEFGFQGGLRWRVPLARRAGLDAGVRWDMMFTRPDYSHAAAATAGVTWTP